MAPALLPGSPGAPTTASGTPSAFRSPGAAIELDLEAQDQRRKGLLAGLERLASKRDLRTLQELAGALAGKDEPALQANLELLSGLLRDAARCAAGGPAEVRLPALDGDLYVAEHPQPGFYEVANPVADPRVLRLGRADGDYVQPYECAADSRALQLGSGDGDYAEPDAYEVGL